MKSSTGEYWDNIQKAAECIFNADVLLIGVGSGLTASGGLNYTDPSLAEKWYPEYFKLGKKSIIEIMSGFWPNSINRKNATAFWGFWARHIWHIRYEPQALKPYLDLFSIASHFQNSVSFGNGFGQTAQKDSLSIKSKVDFPKTEALENPPNRKKYFICSTNVDGQLEKAGFDKNLIFAPQGDYALFQCSTPCSQDVYDNNKMITTMIENMVSPFEIRPGDIPFCPKCGNYLMPNLRCDDAFVETPHIKNADTYKTFIKNAFENNIVMLELGVGFNTPVIIRYPFEVITLQYPHAKLIRVNIADDVISKKIIDKSIFIQHDIGKVLSDILSKIRTLANFVGVDGAV
jgi:NAD-dependent SIR2 family protein deacetylase